MTHEIKASTDVVELLARVLLAPFKALPEICQPGYRELFPAFKVLVSRVRLACLKFAIVGVLLKVLGTPLGLDSALLRHQSSSPIFVGILFRHECDAIGFGELLLDAGQFGRDPSGIGALPPPSGSQDKRSDSRDGDPNPEDSGDIRLKKF